LEVIPKKEKTQLEENHPGYSEQEIGKIYSLTQVTGNTCSQ
jgi:hypothetical protein